MKIRNKQTSRFLFPVAITFLTLLLILVNCTDITNSSGWQVVDDIPSDDSLIGSYYPSIAVDKDNIIYVSGLRETENRLALFVNYWDGNHWQEIENDFEVSGSTRPEITVSNDLIPYLTDSSFNIQYWNGEDWQFVGGKQGETITEGIVRRTTSIVTVDNEVYMVWEDHKRGNESWEIYLAHWNGQQWEEIGSSLTGTGVSNTGGFSTEPSVAVSTKGEIYVVWVELGKYERERYKNSVISVKRWNGNKWESLEVEDSVENELVEDCAVYASNPQIIVSPDNIPYLIWQIECGNYFELVVYRWDGESWASLGDGPLLSGILDIHSSAMFDPQIASSQDGKIYVAWTTSFSLGNDIHVKQWNGESWVSMSPSDKNLSSNVSNSEGDSLEPSLAIKPDGKPCVAWEEHTYRFVRRPISLKFVDWHPRIIWREELLPPDVKILVSCYHE